MRCTRRYLPPAHLRKGLLPVGFAVGVTIVMYERNFCIGIARP